MVILSSLIWGCLTLVSMILTFKFYLPRLETTRKDDRLGALAVSEKRKIVFIVTGSVFAACCGYIAWNNCTSFISYFKLMSAMIVLCIVAVTDSTLMLIPNMCSIVLCVCRAITIISEFIFFRDIAVNSLIDSVITVIIVLILLLIMSKVTHGGLGMGDVKILSSIGFLSGLRSVMVSMMLAFILCALFSTYLLLCKRKHLKDAIPLAPFMWAGYGIGIILSIM